MSLPLAVVLNSLRGRRTKLAARCCHLSLFSSIDRVSLRLMEEKSSLSSNDRSPHGNLKTVHYANRARNRFVQKRRGTGESSSPNDEASHETHCGQAAVRLIFTDAYIQPNNTVVVFLLLILQQLARYVAFLSLSFLQK